MSWTEPGHLYTYQYSSSELQRLLGFFCLPINLFSEPYSHYVPSRYLADNMNTPLEICCLPFDSLPAGIFPTVIGMRHSTNSIPAAAPDSRTIL